MGTTRHHHPLQTAKVKIEHALNHDDTRLYLRGMELTELPEAVRKLKKLQFLNLLGNRLTDLPEWLCELEQLYSLNIFHNRFNTLPSWLGQLKSLRRLNVSRNLLTSLPESTWPNSLRALDISHNHLTSLPELTWPNQLRTLDISHNQLTSLPQSLANLPELQSLDAQVNKLTSLPESLGELKALEVLNLRYNQLQNLPESLGQLEHVRRLDLNQNRLTSLPESMGQLRQLESLELEDNALTDLPPSLSQLYSLEVMRLSGNPLNLELRTAYSFGHDALRRYLIANAAAEVVLNEAKLILIGEGEVGKSCLLGALREDPWVEGRPTTHGIDIKTVKVTEPNTNTVITLNGWDFGGQRVYRPTHQLFFSSPAIYLVVWKPREGPQQGFVNEWIRLVKYREPDAKIFVVSTHGGPKERQPDIDRQEIWSLFGADMVQEFFQVENKPDEETGERRGIAKLKDAIARVALSLPEVGRKIPKRWEDTRRALKETGAPYMLLEKVLEFCRERKMEEAEAKDFVRISHRLGHLVHYEHDPALRDIVILKPDWLSTAISFVLDDQQTRDAHGLVEFAHLARLWNDPQRPPESRYDAELHPLFLRLMERFDLSYKVAIPSEPEDAIGFLQRLRNAFAMGKNPKESATVHYTSLIAQLVPDVRPDAIPGWTDQVSEGDQEQSQICRIVEIESRQSAAAEGLFFQLIVRLHKYSLGRAEYLYSVHWRRGLVLEDDYGALALLEHIGNDVRISVRSPYPERFLSALTYEVKWLVQTFWAGLRCEIMVPCLNPKNCIGLFEVQSLLENKKRNHPKQPCHICNEWQSIELLLHNAPAARAVPFDELLANSNEVLRRLEAVRMQLQKQHVEMMGGLGSLNANDRRLMSKVDAVFTGLLRTLTDEAKDGPRLFSFEPISPGFFDRPKWISEKFRITLWCEHSRLPLPSLCGKDDERGVYELTLPRDWVVKAAPFLKLVTGILSLVAPIASSATKLMLDDAWYNRIEKQLDLGQKSLDSVIKGGEKVGSWLSHSDAPNMELGELVEAQGAVLRQLHSWLKQKDSSFGGLVRVQNKRQEFLWVHPQFEREY